MTDESSPVVNRLASALADRYRIEREIGAGGMATVYLAHDLKHDRDVAIKVLHPDLGAALGGERFLKEIRTTAKLQHPHILPLLDSGEADGLLYYVMPYVRGQTLRQRLEREQQLPLDDAVTIAREVADALDSAHSIGIIHRDIKPENILLRGNHALVADFGIALAVQQAAGSRMTQTGLSLGTPQYMSPEQAMGERSIDARSDIYALGAVTYEMLVGEPPFTGPTVQAIVAKAMTERPVPPRTIRDTIPANVEHAVLRALAKLRADRFATGAEFASALISQSTSSTMYSTARNNRSSARNRARDPFVLGLGAGVILLGAAATALSMRSPAAIDAFPARIEIAANTESPNGAAALSPDGHSIVFVGRDPAGAGNILYLRRLNQLSSRAIPGTASATPPVFSPDGKWVAFIAGRRRIVKVPVDGGAAVPLGDVPDYGGIDWSSNGDIVVGAGVMEGLGGLARVNAEGGSLVALTKVDKSKKELSHQWPRVLTDGKTVLFTVWYGSVAAAELAATSLDDGKVVPLGIKGAQAIGVVDGQLLFSRGDGMIMAMPFDVQKRRASGEARLVQDSVRMRGISGGTGLADVFVTDKGALVFARGTAERRLTWVDRSGASTPLIDEKREFQFVRLSPDNRQAAVVIANGLKTDLWIIDIAASTLTPLTTTGATRNPVWSSDGHRVLYVSTHGGRSAFWWQAADGSAPPVKAGEARHNAWNIDMSPDDNTVVFNALYSGTFNIATFSLDPTHQQRDLAASPTATESNARFSPDGRLVAYASDESGRPEAYVRPFLGVGGRVQISANGGRRPIWSRDGSRIYFWEGSRMMSAVIGRDPALRVVSREALFDGLYEQDFDVSRDGRRLLMIESKNSGVSLVVVPNWLTELKQLTAARKR